MFEACAHVKDFAFSFDYQISVFCTVYSIFKFALLSVLAFIFDNILTFQNYSGILGTCLFGLFSG